LFAVDTWNGIIRLYKRVKPQDTSAGEAHLARAQNLYRGYVDYDAALAELRVAAQTLPNDADVFELRGYIQRRHGKQEEAVGSLERAIDLDPPNIFMLQQITAEEIDWFPLSKRAFSSIC
jgi:tetratricopeptide (TPR) repeat protein